MSQAALREDVQEVRVDVAVRLSGVTVRLGRQTVLKDLNLTVPHGEFLAVIGPSGEGKSTLLRVLAGLLRPAEGTVAVASPPALMFQDDRLLPWRTALRNVELPRDLGTGGTLAPREALHLVGMDAYCGYFPAQLSGGMRARVALARALAQSNDVLLLDEPFAALDALVRERFNAELRHLHEKTGRTTILVTHSIREAATLADRVAVLRGGRILAVLDTREKTQAPPASPIETQLRSLLGAGDSTRIQVDPPAQPSRGWLAPTAALLAGLLLWEVVARALHQPFILPSPTQVWAALLKTPSEFAGFARVTVAVTLLGGLLGSLAGVLIGYPLGKSRPLERFLSPFVVASQSTPIVVLVPILTAWFGFGALPAVLVSALSALYPLMVSTIVGVREVRATDHELFSTLHATPWQRLTRLELPSALPVMLGGLRLSLSLALIGAVVWETVTNQTKGLGYALNQARTYYDMPRQFAAIVLLVLLGVALYLIVTTLERRALRRRGR
ncbi:ABC transporter permease subunit [Deinococcus hopiensis]|uniref:NitT/TauT family transport system ATP-binding protein n=1 Tax=Deinococcus hopiensis KR-140 TaxID=695939 RepID=A0A1W1VRP6_9DEIO|nr:ABC transporter permease subunit [Deinococcus hopiensis]SMB96006.1 NitT/TauT family transport system ATP-binding protein [Deinococcus hopiensis KR-140]